MPRAPGAPVVSLAQGVVLTALTAAAALALHVLAIDSVGFPDGHRTEYERWALPYLRIALAGLLVLAVTFATLAASRTDSPTAARWFRVALVAAALILLGAFVLIPAIGQHVLHLEHGQGG